MKNLDLKKNFLPHILAIITFVMLVVVYYNPVFFENKAIRQNDVLQGEGSAAELKEYRELTGEEGLWTNSMFGGMPGYLIHVQFSGDLLQHLQSIYYLWLAHPARLTFMAMLSFYILLVVMGVRPYLAIAGGIAFGLGSFNIISIEAGHNSKVLAITYMPLVLAGIYMAFYKNKLWGFTLTAFALALQLRANHLQITYYLLLIVVIFGIIVLIGAIKEKILPHFFKTMALLFGALIIAIGCNFGKLWTIFEYSPYSIRGEAELTAPGQEPANSGGLDRDYAFHWSSGKLESFTLLVPNLYGGGSVQDVGMNSVLADALESQGVPPAQIRDIVQAANTYWGDQPGVAGPIYAGAIVCFLFIIGIIFADKRFKWWLIIATILSLLLAWGKNLEWFNYFMFDYLPGYNKFRAVSMALVIALLCIPLLGFLGLEKLMQQKLNKITRKKLLTAVGVSAGLALLIWVFGSMADFSGPLDVQLASGGYPPWLIQALQDQRASMLTADAFRSVFFILAAGAVIYFFMKEKLNKTVALTMLALLVTVDLWAVDKRFLNEENYSRSPKQDFFAPTEADQFILQDTAMHYRVFNLQNPWNEARTSFHHKSIGGYHGAKMRRYQDLIDRCLSEETNALIQNFNTGNFDFSNFGTINMLNTKYLLAGNTREAVIENEQALGNAWLVGEVIKANSPDEEINALCALNTATTAVVDVSQFPLPQTNFNTNGSIELVEYKPNYLKYTANTAGEAFIVFSEIYYPIGWEVKLNGERTDYMRANYLLRAMTVPTGQHTIEFTFAPDSYFIGNKVMLGSSILLILLLAGSIFVSIKKLI